MFASPIPDGDQRHRSRGTKWIDWKDSGCSRRHPGSDSKYNAATLIRNATVITMDDRLGDLPSADVDRIAAVGNIAPADVEIVDGSASIVIPGLINAHMHTWQTALRGINFELDPVGILPKDACGLGDGFSAGGPVKQIKATYTCDTLR